MKRKKKKKKDSDPLFAIFGDYEKILENTKN